MACKRWMLFLLVFFAPVLYAQNIPFSDIVLRSDGRPIGGAGVAVCSQGLSTTAASVTANVATLTMLSNPVTAGFAPGMTITISGFIGADTYLNAGTVQQGQITGGVTILSVTSTTISFLLNHANATATSNGQVFQEGNQAIPCAPLATITYDQAGLFPIAQPGFVADAIGNYSFYGTVGFYNVQFYGPGVTVKLKPISLASGSGASILPLNNVWTATNNFANGLQIYGLTAAPFSGAAITADCVNVFSTSPLILGDAGAACSAGGGAGTVVASPQYQIPLFPTAGSVATVKGSNITTDSTFNDLFVPGSVYHTGPNPWLDASQYGMRAVSSAFTATANCGGTTAVTFTAGSYASFQNGDGIVLYGCGATNALATPGAPTVTPSLQSGPDQMNDTVAAPAASTSYSYTIVARDKNGGLTAQGSAGTTSTGSASLGTQQVSVSTLARSNNIVTVNTSAGINCAVGAIVFVTNSTDASFSGMYQIASCPSGTQFTYKQGMDTRAGASTSATGGTAQVFSVNHLTWTAVSGAWQYYIYKGGVLVGVTRPGENYWSDLGVTAPTLPDFVPTSAPGSATNDYLATTIASGGGTASVVLAAAASQTISGVKAKFDNGPTLLKAYNAAAASGNTTLHLPNPGNGLGYFVNSHTVFGGSAPVTVLHSGALTLNETLETAQVNWNGILGGNSTSGPQFSWSGGQPVTVNTAYPGIYAQNPSTFQFVAFSANSQGLIAVAQDGFGFNTSFQYDSFVFPSNDVAGQAIVFEFGSTVELAYDLFATNDSAAYGYSIVPLVLSRNDIPNADPSGDISLDLDYWVGRGYGISSNPAVGAGANVRVRQNYGQALLAPLLEIGNYNNLYVTVDHFTQDTSSQAVIASWNGGLTASLRDTVNVSTEASGPPGIVTGLPINLTANNVGSILGQDTNVFYNQTNVNANVPMYGFGKYSLFAMAAPMHFPAQHSLFWDLPTPTGLAASPVAGGSLSVGAHNYAVMAIGQDGAYTVPSAPVTCTTTLGNQTCSLTWTPVLGAASYALVDTGTSNVFATGIGSAAYSDSTHGCCTLTEPAQTGTGLTTIEPNQVITPSLVLSGPLSGGVSSNATLTATNTGGNVVLQLPTTSGILCTTAVCGGGGGGPSTLAFPIGASGVTTSGGIPYFSSGVVLSSSGLLALNHVVLGGGAGGAPTSDANLDDGATTSATLTYAGSGGITASAGQITGTTFKGSSFSGSTLCLHSVSGVITQTSGDCSTGGTVTSVALTTPSWLTVAGTPVTTTGTLAISAQTGQTSHQVIGTCGSLTTFQPCALVGADLPAINLAGGSSVVTGLLPHANIAATTVTPGSYTSANITVAADGSITAASNGSGGGGSVGPGTTNGIAYFNAGTTVTSPTPPSANGQYACGYLVTAGVTVPPTCPLLGIAGATISAGSTTYPVTYADNGTVIVHDVAASASATTTIPTAATLGNTSFSFAYTNHSSHSDTVSATSPEVIQAGTSAAALTLTVGSATYCRFKRDTFNANTWDADCAPNGGAGSVAFSSVTSGTGTGTYTIGTGGSLTVSGSGTNNATAWDGVTLSGTALNGQCPVASSSSAAAWGSCGSTLTFPATVAGTTTSGHFPYFSGSTTLSNNANLDDSATVANTLTYVGTSGFTATLGPIQAGLSGSGVGQPFIFQEGTVPVGIASKDVCYGDSTLHGIKCSYNNGSFFPNLLGPASSTVGNLVSFNSTGGHLTQDSGVASANVVTAANAATAANQVCTASGASKTCTYIDFPETHWMPAANCFNANPGDGWSSNVAAVCTGGTNNKGAYIPLTSSTTAQFNIGLPLDYDVNNRPGIRFFFSSADTTSGHTVIPSIQVSCTGVNGGTTDDVTFNAAHSSSTTTLNSTANQFWANSSVTFNATDVTGCSAGSMMTVQISRATDTSTSAAKFYGAMLTIHRLIADTTN